jgi:predicted LPLAT superfamily acyltransferase
MSSWNGKSKGSLGGYKMFVYTIRFFGLNAAYVLLKIASLYYVIFYRTSSGIIYRYFRTRFQYTPVQAFFKTWNNHYIFGQTLVDKTVLFSGIKNKFTFHFDGEEHLRKISEEQNGGILISAHMGNWDIAGNFLHSRIQNEINVVMYDQEHEQIKQYFEALHKNKQMNIIPIKNDMSHIFGISQALQDRELICIHGDRFMEGVKTVSRNFLGEEARFPAGPFAIASKFEVPVVFVYAVKESKWHYHLYCTPPKVYKNKYEELIEDYVASLETMTRKYPEQWFNYYDFWKKSA